MITVGFDSDTVTLLVSHEDGTTITHSLTPSYAIDLAAMLRHAAEYAEHDDVNIEALDSEDVGPSDTTRH